MSNCMPRYGGSTGNPWGVIQKCLQVRIDGSRRGRLCRAGSGSRSRRDAPRPSLGWLRSTCCRDRAPTPRCGHHSSAPCSPCRNWLNCQMAISEPLITRPTPDNRSKMSKPPADAPGAGRPTGLSGPPPGPSRCGGGVHCFVPAPLIQPQETITVVIVLPGEPGVTGCRHYPRCAVLQGMRIQVVGSTSA